MTESTDATRCRATVVIPTTVSSLRADSLRRAIESIHLSSNLPVQIVVVANGSNCDFKVIEWLGTQTWVRLLRLKEASTPAALYAGRCEVRTEFFCFLDDDDEYLEGGLDARIQLLDRRPDADCAVTSGYYAKDGVDLQVVPRVADVEADPLRALLSANWLASCGGLFRSERVEAKLFERLPRHMHWTWLAFLLCVNGKTVVALDEPTFRIHDLDVCSSRTDTYRTTEVPLLERMLELAVRPDVRKVLRQRLAQANHDMADHFLDRGDLLGSWKHHIRSLGVLSGLRYLPFTAHVLAATLLQSRRARPK